MTEPKPSEILRKAADLIEPEGRWTQNAFARGKSGVPVDEAGRSAVCFCLVGAIYRSSRRNMMAANPALQLVRRLVKRDIFSWNDSPRRKQETVVSALRQAAQLAESEGR